MSLQVTSPIVSVEWLQTQLQNKDIIILDCTIPKVTGNSEVLLSKKEQIKGAVFFDIKNVFSDKNATFPNTVLSVDKFEKKAQELGINNHSIIVCYDDLGMYSAPRVWWMFHLMGFKNSMVLDGGFPEWVVKNFPVEEPQKREVSIGDFKAQYQPQKIKTLKEIQSIIDDTKDLIVDARAKDRFYGIVPEPRKGVRNGHIPNSVNLPYTEILERGKLKSEEELKTIFKEVNPYRKKLVFSCGTGITASILALGAEVIKIEDYSVYDGSWTEWGSIDGLPIEK